MTTPNKLTGLDRVFDFNRRMHPCRLRTVKKELEQMERRREEYKRERRVHQRQLRCHQHQLTSAYLGRRVANPQGVVLHGRYLLLRLLGRGGFSEVYRALDLLDLRHVACKIHRVSSLLHTHTHTLHSSLLLT
eukprot:Tamp_34707.p1 GENE.Tamp_34707~~Tamp_34707.p1  ORF type:complete len:133 (-),score=17.06 Tamp_34707:88-486(-)